DLILLESSGIGQSDTEIIEHADASLYVMTPEFGAQSQLEKIDMLDFADIVAINKFDRRGAKDALRDVKKQVQRNHKAFDVDAETMQVYGTMAATFGDPGTNRLYRAIAHKLNELRPGEFESSVAFREGDPEGKHVIPGERVRYLAEIVENNRKHNTWVMEQAALAERCYVLAAAKDALPESAGAARTALQEQHDLAKQ